MDTGVGVSVSFGSLCDVNGGAGKKFQVRTGFEELTPSIKC